MHQSSDTGGKHIAVVTKLYKDIIPGQSIEVAGRKYYRLQSSK